MIVGNLVERQGTSHEAADTITLDEDARQRQRMAMVSDGGIAFLLDLAEAMPLKEGDLIVLDDGRRIAVKAKPEPLLAVRGRDPHHLLALAWRIGHRHLAVQTFDDRLHIRPDALIRELLEEAGATIEDIEAPFDADAGEDDLHPDH